LRLTCLGEQDQRRGVGGLQAEGEVEEDEGVDVEINDPGAVQGYPGDDEKRLTDQVIRRAEKARYSFRELAERAGPERPRQVEAAIIAFMAIPPRWPSSLQGGHRYLHALPQLRDLGGSVHTAAILPPDVERIHDLVADGVHLRHVDIESEAMQGIRNRVEKA